MEEIYSKAGKKETQTVKKAPIFTFCKQMKNAVEKLALRSLYGHEKYEKGDDWSNFARVPNADFEYSNSQFRHALEIGGEETEEDLKRRGKELKMFTQKDYIEIIKKFRNA